MARFNAVPSRYRPIYRRSGYAVATGPGSVLFGNSLRFRLLSGARAWANRARRNVRLRRLAMQNLRRFGYPSTRRIR